MWAWPFNLQSGGNMLAQTQFAMAFLALAYCCVSAGCHTRPNWGPQGTIGTQRTKAILHDPFPSNDLGPPIQGGRPLGFEQPKSESAALQSSPFSKRAVQGGQYVPTYGF